MKKNIKINFFKEIKEIQKNNEINLNKLLEINKIKQNYMIKVFKRNKTKFRKEMINKKNNIIIITNRKYMKLKNIEEEINNIKTEQDLKCFLKKVVFTKFSFPKTFNKLLRIERTLKDIIIMSNFGIINNIAFKKFPDYMIDDILILQILEGFINQIYKYDSDKSKFSTFIFNTLRFCVNDIYNHYQQKIISKEGFNNLIITLKIIKEKNVNLNRIKRIISIFLSEEEKEYLNSPKNILVWVNGLVNNSKIYNFKNKKFYNDTFVKDFFNLYINNMKKNKKEEYKIIEASTNSQILKRYNYVSNFLYGYLTKTNIKKNNYYIEVEADNTYMDTLQNDISLEEEVIQENFYEINNNKIKLKEIEKLIKKLNFSLFVNISKKDILIIKKLILPYYKNEKKFKEVKEDIYCFFKENNIMFNIEKDFKDLIEGKKLPIKKITNIKKYLF